MMRSMAYAGMALLMTAAVSAAGNPAFVKYTDAVKMASKNGKCVAVFAFINNKGETAC